MFDIIGDIHGYADALDTLLARLGYRPYQSSLVTTGCRAFQG